jgi:hypothetical protein
VTLHRLRHSALTDLQSYQLFGVAEAEVSSCLPASTKWLYEAPRGLILRHDLSRSAADGSTARSFREQLQGTGTEIGPQRPGPN